MTPQTKRQLAQALGWTIGGSLAATFAFMNGSSLSWPRIIEQTLGNILFSGCCVALCLVGLPVVVPFAHRRVRFPFDWLLILGVIVAFGVMGSFVAALAAIVIGVAPRGLPLMSWYPASMKVSVYFTVIFGLSGTVIQELRTRLASTTLALRTKERDEAEARRLVAEARLASLEARVDPHFLFNTLNSIAALVRDKPADAERMIEQLASLMRSSLDRRASLVTLGEELDSVRSYLEIERVRFGDRLRFHIEPLANARAPLVPRLAIQTLVENSVKYAVSPSRDGAVVNVTATSSGGRLRLTVEDNGPGFVTSHMPDGHGLQLLKSRLAMTFGDRAQLLTESRPGHTAMTLDLPFETVMPEPPAPGGPPLPAENRC